MDIILHKLTEDILCMSQLSIGQGSRSETSGSSLSQADKAAVRRVQRLSDFVREQPHCCLVDDPNRIQTVMSRSEIASKLHDCLQNVKTTSGMLVASPKYSVVELPSETSDTSVTAHIEQQLKGLSYPIIIKPLIAAGTKASHAMAVLMDPSGLGKMASKLPCLCQEFSNHDTTLYKVYVLGDYVSVHKRRSLPNLPLECASSRMDYVEFDSHRPYPRLSDFGFDENSVEGKRSKHLSQEKAEAPVTKDEVMPVVNALKKAFGLELFGFDVLLVSNQHTMLVVDVNYFPSYKEVQNFPSLLAKYLTDRAIQSRREAIKAAKTATAGDEAQ